MCQRQLKFLKRSILLRQVAYSNEHLNGVCSIFVQPTNSFVILITVKIYYFFLLPAKVICKASIHMYLINLTNKKYYFKRGNGNIV